MTLHRVAVLFIVVMFLFASTHALPEEHTIWIGDIPTDRATWNGCCGHEDCKEAKRIKVSWIRESLSIIKVDDYPTFVMRNEDIHKSLNGKIYTCRVDVSKPPTTRNIQCIIVGMSLS